MQEALTPEQQAEIDRAAAEKELMIRWARDLSTCTEAEIRERWPIEIRPAIDKIDREAGGFEGRLKDHNPIYYLAEQLFFDDQRGAVGFLYPPLHRDRLCKILLEVYLQPHKATAGLLILIQRESFKSTFMHGVMPYFVTLREWHLHRKHTRIALVHQKFHQASVNLERLESKACYHTWLREVWPEFTAKESFGTKESLNWPIAAETMKQIGSFSVTAAGLTSDLTGFHFDHVFFSDLVVKEHAKSQVMREDTEMRFNAFLYTLDFTGGRRWIDGTRYHIHDLYGKILKGGKYSTLVVSAGTTPDTLSFPTRHSWEVLQAMREEEIAQHGTDINWWLQMQNEVGATGMIAADKGWFRYCNLSEVPQWSFRCIFVDPAWKGTENQGKGDSASIQAWAFEQRGNLVVMFLLDHVHSNELTDLDGRKEVGRMMRRFNIMHVAPEERGGKSFSTNLANDAVSWGLPLAIIPLKTMQVGKTQRITAWIAALQSGRVFLTNECPMTKPLLDQVEDYPQVEHDDAIDCAAYTVDPAIAEQFTPIFNARALDQERPFWMRRLDDQTEPQRTRYCGN